MALLLPRFIVPSSFSRVALDGATYWEQNGVVGSQDGPNLLFGFKGVISSAISGLRVLMVVNGSEDVVLQFSGQQMRVTWGRSFVRINNLVEKDQTQEILISLDPTAATAAEGLKAYRDGVDISSGNLIESAWEQGEILNPNVATSYLFRHNVAGRELVGSVEYIYAAYPAALPDISDPSVRDRFLPGQIGANGEGPTGSAPALYMTGNAAEWNSGQQLGTGGDFVTSGSFTDL